jgi:hypothetical protein
MTVKTADQSMTAGKLELGPYLDGTSRPTFLGTHGGRTVHVELDSSAMWTLADDATSEALARMLNRKRGQIRAAAQLLIERGLVAEGDGVVRVIVSGIDL